MFELRHLRYFLTVAELQHVTRAATVLNVTQSTLSHQIRQLEEQLGAALFDRVGRGVRLTQAGEVFRTFVLRALAEIDAGKSALAEMENLVRGTLRIGVIHTYNSTLVPPVVSRFVQDYPGVRVIVEDLPASAIENDIADGTLDLGIAFSPAAREDIATEPLFQDELVLIVRRDHALATRKRISASTLARVPLALQTTRFATRRLIDASFGDWIREGVHLEMSSIESLLQTVRLGSMGTIVSERAFGDDPELVKIKIGNPGIVRVAAVLWSRERYRTVAARRFAEMFRAQCSVP